MLKKQRTFFFIVALLASFISLAQDYTRYNWFFTGNDQALIFGKDEASNPIVYTGKSPQNNTGEKVTATDNITGDLIFYSDGSNIYDGTFQIMLNGDNIDSDPNGIQVLATSPVPGNNQDLFYLFHRNAAGEILYTVVDRNIQGNRVDGLPSGEVDITEKIYRQE